MPFTNYDEPIEWSFQAIQSTDVAARMEAVEYLSGCEPGLVIPRLIEALRIKDDRLTDELVRVDIGRVLREFGPLADAAVPALVALIQYRSWTFLDPFLVTGPAVFSAILALKAIQIGVVRELEALLECEDPAVRFNAVLALEGSGENDPDAIPLLAKALNDANRWVRAGAALALLRLKLPGDQVRQALRRALGDPDRIVQIRADYALTAIDPNHERSFPRAFGWLKKQLRSDDDRTRAKAAETLQELGFEGLAAVPELLKNLRGSRLVSPQETAAINHFAKLESSVLLSVLQLLRHHNDRVSFNALCTLAHLGPARSRVLPVLYSRLRAQNWPSSHICLAVGILAEDLDTDRECIPILIRILRERRAPFSCRELAGPDPRQIACLALQSVGREGRQEVVNALRHVQGDPDDDVRMTVWRVLRRLEPSLAAEACPAPMGRIPVCPLVHVNWEEWERSSSAVIAMLTGGEKARHESASELSRRRHALTDLLNGRTQMEWKSVKYAWPTMTALFGQPRGWESEATVVVQIFPGFRFWKSHYVAVRWPIVHDPGFPTAFLICDYPRKEWRVRAVFQPSDVGARDGNASQSPLRMQEDPPFSPDET